MLRLRDRVSGRSLVALRGLLELLNRVGPLRRAGARLCRRMTDSTVSRLRRHPDVAGVFARGSYGRGDAKPFVSDLDLVVIAREPEGRPSLEGAQSIQAAIEAAARTNPLLRDRWQLVLGEGDLGLVARYAELFSVQEWSGDGPPIPACTDTLPEHLPDVASWNRQHMWTDEAQRYALSPVAPTTRSLLAFTAAEKKAAYHWAKIVHASPGERRALPAGGRELAERCGVLVRRLGETATALGPPEQPAGAVREADAAPDLPGLFRSADIAPLIQAAYRYEAGLVVIHEESADLGTLCARLPAVASAAGRRIALYSPAAATCAPLLGNLVELWRKPGAAGLPIEPAFLREQFVYEALFGGAELRLRAAPGTVAYARKLCTARLIRWLTFLRSGRLLGADEDAVAAAPPVDLDDVAAWFTVATSLWLELRELLEAIPFEGDTAE